MKTESGCSGNCVDERDENGDFGFLWYLGNQSYMGAEKEKGQRYHSCHSPQEATVFTSAIKSSKAKCYYNKIVHD